MALGRRAAEKRRRKTGLGLILFFALVFCGVMLYRRVLLEQEEAKVNAAYQTALEQYEAEMEREEELEELQIYTKTKKFIEDIAREKFGLVYENEIIFEPEK